MLAYEDIMFSKVMNLFKGNKTSKRADVQEATVDISRVIPNYSPPSRHGETVESSRDVPAPETQILDDIDTISAPADLDTLQNALSDSVDDIGDDLADDADLEAELSAPTRDDTPASMHEMEDRAEAAIAALSEKHDTWAQSDLNALQAAWNEAKLQENLQGHLTEVQRNAHNLKGMATTYGHPAISRLASSLCVLLKSDRAAHQHALINLHIEACRAAYFEGAKTEGGDMVAQSVCVALETQVKRMLDQA